MLHNIFGTRVPIYLAHLNKDNTITTRIKAEKVSLFKKDKYSKSEQEYDDVVKK
jgi:hypothetical protein